MTEATLLNRLRRYGYGQHYGPMAKACAEAAEILGVIQPKPEGNYDINCGIKVQIYDEIRSKLYHPK